MKRKKKWWEIVPRRRPYIMPPLPCYVVLKGRETGIFLHDAKRPLNSITGIQDAICYIFTNYIKASVAFVSKNMDGGTLVTEEDLKAILEQKSTCLSQPLMLPRDKEE